MYTDREEFEGWMERIMERFDRTEKLLERVLKKNNTLDGEEVLDNQDLCLLLKVGIRTLQRYRAIGVLPYFTISGKVFYRTKDVHEFIRTRFADVEERAAKRKEKEARKEERRRKRVNTALQYLRKNDVINQSAPLEELPEEYEEPDASDVEAIPQKVLMQFIEELPAGYRTVFNLYTFEDKSHKEIAQELGINEKSSASQLFRAKSVLAKRVKEWIMHNG